MKNLFKETLESLPELDKNKKIILSLSGGLDSTTLAQLLVYKYGNENVCAIGFDYNQRHKDIELQLAKTTANILGIKFEIYKLDYLNDMVKDKCSLVKSSELTPGSIEIESTRALASTYVPFRNLQFAAITAAYAETNEGQYIMLGVQSDDLYSYPDTSKEYFDAFQNILNMHRSHVITQVMPFAELTKADELIIAKELTNLTGISLKSWSCYNGITDEEDRRMCGNCATCSERIIAHIKAGDDNNSIKDMFKLTDEEIDKLREQL